MRVLYLATNRIYTNNTQQLFPLAISSISEVTFYGPGFVGKEILKKGVKSFVENSDLPFDFLMTDGMIFFWNQSKGSTAFNISYNYFSLNTFLLDTIADMKQYFLESDMKKILYPNIDFYNVSEEEIQNLERANTYLLTWGIELLEYKRNLPDLKFESFHDRVNDNWINYIQKNPERIISIPHIISEIEFCFHAVSSRKFDIAVPGVNYHSRKKINNIINKTSLSVNNRNTSYLQKINIYLLRKFTTRSNLKIFNQIFNNTIEDSKIAYTCGSGLDYLIRKFFEIPAKGTLLFCKPFKGFEEIGFKDNENCIVVNSNNIVAKAEEILNDKDRLVEIAEQGKKLIWKNHSFTARQDQMDRSFRRILNNDFKGSYWEDGKFHLR